MGRVGIEPQTTRNAGQRALIMAGVLPPKKLRKPRPVGLKYKREEDIIRGPECMPGLRHIALSVMICKPGDDDPESVMIHGIGHEPDVADRYTACCRNIDIADGFGCIAIGRDPQCVSSSLDHLVEISLQWVRVYVYPFRIYHFDPRVEQRIIDAIPDNTGNTPTGTAADVHQAIAIVIADLIDR